MGRYVNSPGEDESCERKTETCRPGGSKLCRLVGVSFGLLCIIQSALNVCLRLQGAGSKHIDSTNDSTNDSLTLIAEISVLLLDIEQLEKENSDLQDNNNYLTGANKMLKEQLGRHLNHTTELQAEIERLKARECKQPEVHGCPLTWTPYGSSCYLLSTERKDWRYARADCKREGAHLVVLNDDLEKNVLNSLWRNIVWIGLKAQRQGQVKTWTWVDGSPLNDVIYPQLDDQQYFCAYSEISRFGLSFVQASCVDEHYWLCEKDVK